MKKVTELFSVESEQKVARRRLKNALTGAELKLGSNWYVKIDDDTVRERAPEVAEADDDADGVREMDWVQVLLGVFGPYLRMVRTEYDGRYVLHTLDPKSLELRIANTDYIVAKLRNHIGPAMSLHKADAAARRMFDKMQCESTYIVNEAQIAPVLLSDVDTEGLTYKRLAVSSERLEEEPGPLQDLLKLVKEEEGRRALKLWLGSILDPKTERVQYLCLYGGGRNGKSTLLDSLAHVFGSAALAMSSGAFMNRFGLSSAVNKRLMLFDDNNNAGFMSSGDFKRITGSDTMSVERKGKDRFEVRNNIKVLIATNRMPQLRGDEADLRRNIFVEMEEYKETGVDGTAWQAAFRLATPDILRHCYTTFQDYRKEKGTSHIPEVTGGREKIEAMSWTEGVQDLLDQWFTSTPTDHERLTPATPESLRKRLIDAKVSQDVAALAKERLVSQYPVKRLENGKGARVFTNLFLKHT